VALEIIALTSVGMLAAVWVLYPAAVGVVAALVRHRPLARELTEPKVSVVIATREDPKEIWRRVEDCLRTSYPRERLEVVVALDYQSYRDIPVGINSLEPVRCVVGDAPGGKAAALNAGVRAAKGEVLVFTDTRQRFAPDAIGQLVAGLTDERVGAVSGSLQILSGEGRHRPLTDLYWLFERRLRRDEATIHSCVGTTGAIYAMRKASWVPLRPGLILDDLHTPMRLVLNGYRVSFMDKAHAYEILRPTALEEYRRKVRTLTGVVQLCRWMPAVLLPGRNRIWLQFVFHKLLRLLTPYCTLGILVWAIGALAARVSSGVLYGVVVGAAVAVGLVLTAGRASRPVGGGVLDSILQGALLQAATVVGTVNGLIGRWHVWRN
jgi:cellulose synthase/poly-beta-1,6-N-acetylglucosamine synthase-like glycosyltransferase